MKLCNPKTLPTIPKLKLAVIGHIEWVTFLSVEELPKAGLIGHASKLLEEPAGGGAVVAVQLSKLIKQPVHFFTALGKDNLGNKSLERLKELGLILHIAWRDEPTRRAVSFVDSHGERAITVIGKRLQPTANDALPWETLHDFDGIFVTATDSQGLKYCRSAGVLTTTPRIGLQTIKEANVVIDALIGSGLDPAEQISEYSISPMPRLRISTEGMLGGLIWPSDRYQAIKPDAKPIDSYGCGDSFAAGVTAGMAAGWNMEQSISLGAYCGAKCVTRFGPYE